MDDKEIMLLFSEDARECFNDSLLTLWKQIPPDVPRIYRAYLCRIVRNCALNKYRNSHAKKRNISKNVHYSALPGELASSEDVMQKVENKELTKSIEMFLDQLEEDKRIMFVKRYWFCESVKDIAKQFGMEQRQTAVKLGRIKKQLVQYLEQERWL